LKIKGRCVGDELCRTVDRQEQGIHLSHSLSLSLSGLLLKANSDGLWQLTFVRSFGPSGNYLSLSLETAFIVNICTRAHSGPLACSC